MTDDPSKPPPDDTATLEPDHALPPGDPPRPDVEAEPAPAPAPPAPPPSASPAGWEPAPLEPLPPWRPATPVQAQVETWASDPPSQAPPPGEAAPVFRVDPDHFAIAETDEGDDPLQDRALGWFARLIGAHGDGDGGGDARAARTLGWTSRTILIAALTLLVLNAQSLKSWASTLPPQWGSETLRIVAGEWADRLQAVGLDEPRRRIHAAYQTGKTLRWNGSVRRAVK